MFKNKIKSWSISALQLFEQCPLKFYKERIEKDSRGQVKGYHLEKGIAWHKKAEFYLKGEITRMPRELKKFQVEFRNLKKNHTTASEKQIAFTKTWKRTGWWDKDAWLRMVLDARVDFDGDIPLLIDFKTGRIYDKHDEAAELYGLGELINSTHEATDVEYWYLEHGNIKDYTFYRDQVSKLKKHWKDKVAPMFREKKWEPKKNPYCSNCFVKECELHPKRKKK